REGARRGTAALRGSLGRRPHKHLLALSRRRHDRTEEPAGRRPVSGAQTSSSPATAAALVLGRASGNAYSPPRGATSARASASNDSTDSTSALRRTPASSSLVSSSPRPQPGAGTPRSGFRRGPRPRGLRRQ